ncbi:MAG: HAMP domain-containing sensor histidine kinase [Sulfuricurvum sp.]|jgi:signal transduction histidine kinase
MPRRSIKSLFFTLATLSLIVFGIGSFWLYDYIKLSTNTKLSNLSHEKSYEIRHKIIQFYDQMFYEFEVAKPDILKNMVVAQHYFDQHGTDAPLEPLKKLLQTKDFEYEIYLINRDLIIKRTTFPADLGLDFHFMPSVPALFKAQFSDPHKIDLSQPYYESSSANFKRYMTQRSGNGDYIIQLGQSLRGEKSFTHVMTNLKNEIPTLYNSAVFSVFTAANYPWNVQEIWSQRFIGKIKTDMANTEEVSSMFKKILLQIDPTTSGLFLFPKLYLYPYLKTIFLNNTLKEVTRYENHRHIHTIMIPFQSYYQQTERSYCLLVMKFDETLEYTNIQFVKNMMFLALGAVMLLFFSISYLFYRRIIFPITLLESHMHRKTSLDNKTILSKGDEISKISRTYNWLLRDLKNEIQAKQTLLSQFKTFTANAIHQVRTPLSVIKIAHAMIDDNTHKEAKLHILSSLVSIEHLYDSLAFTLQNENTELPISTLNLSSTVEERIKLFSPVASSMDTEIISTIRDNISVMMNQTELEYLIDNNLSNTLKYGQPFKPIILTLTHSSTESILTFESYGNPISDTSAIFERYTRQDNSKQGSGIGLHIVATICEHYNIVIQVTYQDEKNCFRYFFPTK